MLGKLSGQCVQNVELPRPKKAHRSVKILDFTIFLRIIELKKGSSLVGKIKTDAKKNCAFVKMKFEEMSLIACLTSIQILGQMSLHKQL